MGKMSRSKGQRGERELAGILKTFGFNVRRGGAMHVSGADSPDVDGLDGVHIECKRVERLDLYGAMEQSARDTRNGDLPIVAHRKNNSKWLVTMYLDDWVVLYREYFSGLWLKKRKE